MLRTVGSECFSKNGCVARILDLKINCVANVFEKGFETGVAVAFGGLPVSSSEPGQKGENFIWGDVFQFSVAKFV